MSQVTSYSWDEENRMIGVVNPDSSSESFSYSGDGQRRSKSTLDDLINYV
jgi:YD repeat-containing protein